jgi:pimeloyl-ACP methyl ester carboxylesterase
VAALALGGLAAGFELERRVIGRRLRPDLDGPDSEAFFSLRSDGPVVETLDGIRLHVEVDELDAAPASAPRSGTGPGGDGSRPADTAGNTPGTTPGNTSDSAPDSAPDSADEDPPITLVFIHGYALSLDCWHFQRKHFRGRFRMIFYDQRSHGRSGRSSPNLCRIPQLAVDLAQVLQEVAGEGPIVLIGHSMGGMTIMELARQHPEWFGAPAPVDGVGPIIGVGLMCTSSDDLLDPHPVRGLPARAAARLVEPTLALLNRIPTVVENTRKAGSDLAYLVTRQITFPSPVPPSYIKFLGEMLSVTPLEVIGDFYPAFAELDESEGLAVINRIPSTVIGARQDLVTPFRHTTVLMDALPEARTLVLDPCGHMAMIERHDAVDAVLEDLIRRAVTAGTAPGLRRSGRNR